MTTWDKFCTKVNELLGILSYFMISILFGYIVYYLLVEFDAYKLVVGCISLVTMIHLNKSV